MTAQEFLESLPAKVSPDALKGVETTFHFNLDSGDDGILQKTLAVKDGKMSFAQGLVGEAKCVVSTKSDFLMKLVRGEENPMMAVMMGKVKISNTSEMLKYAKLFGIM